MYVDAVQIVDGYRLRTEPCRVEHANKAVVVRLQLSSEVFQMLTSVEE